MRRRQTVIAPSSIQNLWPRSLENELRFEPSRLRRPASRTRFSSPSKQFDFAARNIWSLGDYPTLLCWLWRMIPQWRDCNPCAIAPHQSNKILTNAFSRMRGPMQTLNIVRSLAPPIYSKTQYRSSISKVSTLVCVVLCQRCGMRRGHEDLHCTQCKSDTDRPRSVRCKHR
jgi:hypothetical protein